LWYNDGMKINKGFWSFTLKTIVVAGIITVWLIFLINNREIAVALTPWATLVLAIAAFWAIWQNYRFRKRDRKERLLSEIIEWAIDIARLNFKIYNFVEAQISKESWVESGIGEIVSQFQVVEAKGVYINNIALSSFTEKKLRKAVEAINKEIRKLVDVSVERLDGKVATEAVTKHMNSLRSRITELLEEAAKIKTRDIG